MPWSSCVDNGPNLRSQGHVSERHVVHCASFLFFVHVMLPGAMPLMRLQQQRWVLWLFCSLLSRALGDGTTSTSSAPNESGALRSTNITVELVCRNCGCAAQPSWEGPHSLDSCARTCELSGSYFQHASGTASGGKGDNNCACCPQISTTPGDDGMGVDVYRRTDVVAHYWKECTLCWCNRLYLIEYTSISGCAASCQGYPGFQHANGLKSDGTQGDFNCRCCTIDPTPETMQGTNVYSFEVIESPASTATSGTLGVLLGPFCILVPSVVAMLGA